MTHVIIGGGIGGLSAAYYLTKQTKSAIRLFEASSRVGGWICSVTNENGSLFEQGPRTLRITSKAGFNALNLAEEIGLSPYVKPITKNNTAASNKLLYANKKLHALPVNLSQIFRKLPPFEKSFASMILKMCTDELMLNYKPTQDESIYMFTGRKLGIEFADYAASALACGIFAGDAKELSVKAIARTFFEIEQEHGSIMLGLAKRLFEKNEASEIIPGDLCKKAYREWRLWSFEEGLETFPKAIYKHLQENNVEVSLNKPCRGIKFQNGQVVLTTDGGTEYAEHIFCALPSKDLAKIIGDEHHVLREELSNIPFVTVGVVNLEYEGDVVRNPSFGFLVPPNQKLPILGVTYDTCCFPKEGRTVFTVMMGGKWFQEYFGSNSSEETLLNVAKDQVKNILDIQQEPTNSRVSVLKDCIPQYVVGHFERVERIRNYVKEKQLPLSLFGASYDAVAVNDVILSAKRAVEGKL